MKHVSLYIQTFLLSLTGVLVLCTPLVNAQGLVNGTVTGQECWFHLTMVLMAVCVVGVTLARKGKMIYSFSWADGAFLLYLINMVAGYDWEINLAPDRMIFWLQLGVLWFMLRVIVSNYPVAGQIFFWGMIALGCIEAIWGVKQLYGFAPSNHNLYKLTGSFYNPGPYSGFIAAVLPIALSKAFPFWEQIKEEKFNRLSLLYGFAFLTVACSLCVLPAGMSRTAWLSAIAGMGWVVWNKYKGFRKLRVLWKIRRKQVIGIAVIAVMVAAVFCTGIFLMKKDSANGRLFMWKITALAMKEHPLKGTGTGGFAGSYSAAQERYFRLGNATEGEKLVAGSPEYAFNEYLQTGNEQGFCGLALFLLWTGSCFLQSVKNGRTGISGSIIAFAIFAFASYPLQLPAFNIFLIYLLTLANTYKSHHYSVPSTFFSFLENGWRGAFKKETTVVVTSKGTLPYISTLHRVAISLLICLIAAGSCLLFYRQKENYIHFSKWYTLKMLHDNHAYKEAIIGYKELYPFLHSYPHFLFEYAHCLNKEKRYTESVCVLQRAALLSTDPMIYNVMAKNYQALGNYREAERYLLKSTYLLSERLYPYYLLTKLYMEPGFYNADKINKSARIVLTKEPKVHSTAIREMREEVKEILKTTQAKTML